MDSQYVIDFLGIRSRIYLEGNAMFRQFFMMNELTPEKINRAKRLRVDHNLPDGRIARQIGISLTEINKLTSDGVIPPFRLER